MYFVAKNKLLLPHGGVLALLVSLALGGPAMARSAASKKAKLYSGTISRVVDGDTVWLQTATRRAPAKVRIVGIDAPEICQTGGPESREALRSRLLGQTVSIAVPSSRSRDDYGRLLGRVYWKGEDMGRWMVSRGQAWSYAYRRDPGPYAVEQASGVAARRGLFRHADAENPRSFRKRHGSCHSWHS
jgi:micrococcal nuclease